MPRSNSLTPPPPGREEQLPPATPAWSDWQCIEPASGSLPIICWEARTSADATALELVFVNPVAELLLGYSIEEWLSTPEFWLAVVHPEDRDRAALELHTRLAGGEAGYPQLRWVTKDGQVRWFEAHVSVVLDSAGNAVGLRSLNLDVTASRR